MAGLASAWALARRRLKEYCHKVDAGTRCSGVCPNTWPKIRQRKFISTPLEQPYQYSDTDVAHSAPVRGNTHTHVQSHVNQTKIILRRWNCLQMRATRVNYQVACAHVGFLTKLTSPFIHRDQTAQPYRFRLLRKWLWIYKYCSVGVILWTSSIRDRSFYDFSFFGEVRIEIGIG